MRPSNQNDNQPHVFQSRLDQMINMEHPLVFLAERIDWQILAQKLGEVYIPDKGHPALPAKRSQVTADVCTAVSESAPRECALYTCQKVQKSTGARAKASHFSRPRVAGHEKESSGSFQQFQEFVGDGGARSRTKIKEDRQKLYSYFALEVGCLAKGKAHKKYKLGCKALIVSSSCGNWVVGAKAFHGNPFDGHILGQNLSQMKHRDAIEAILGHMKGNHGMESLLAQE